MWKLVWLKLMANCSKVSLTENSTPKRFPFKKKPLKMYTKLRVNILCFFENLAINYFMFTALHSAKKISFEQQNLGPPYFTHNISLFYEIVQSNFDLVTHTFFSDC